MSTGKVVLGTLAGLAIGGIVGILLAPEKGSATRKKIMDKADDYVDKLKSKVEGVRDSVAQKFESTKNAAENLADKGKAAYDEVKNEVKDAASNFNKNVAPDNNHPRT